MILFINFSPSHREQFCTPSKLTVLLCCFAVSLAYDKSCISILTFPSSNFPCSENSSPLDTWDCYCYYCYWCYYLHCFPEAEKSCKCVCVIISEPLSSFSQISERWQSRKNREVRKDFVKIGNQDAILSCSIWVKVHSLKFHGISYQKTQTEDVQEREETEELFWIIQSQANQGEGLYFI